MGFKECGESVYEYEYEEEYKRDIEISEEENRYTLTRCPNCNSWRILYFEHRVNIQAQTPEAVWDFPVDHARQDVGNDYYHCYDCSTKWKK